MKKFESNIIKNKYGTDYNINKTWGVEMKFNGYRNGRKDPNVIIWSYWKSYYTLSSAIQACFDLGGIDDHRVVSITYTFKHPIYKPIDIIKMLRERKLKRILKHNLS